MKKRYQQQIVYARTLLRQGKTIEAYDILGNILEDMEL